MGSRADLQLNLRRRLPEIEIEVDPIHLETTLINVVTNTRDAIEAGGTITIATSLRSVSANEILGLEEGDHVILEVSDDGYSMPQAVLARALSRSSQPSQRVPARGLGWRWCGALHSNRKGF